MQDFFGELFAYLKQPWKVDWEEGEDRSTRKKPFKYPLSIYVSKLLLETGEREGCICI